MPSWRNWQTQRLQTPPASVVIVQVDQGAPSCGRGGTGRRAGLKPRTFASSKLAARTLPSPSGRRHRSYTPTFRGSNPCGSTNNAFLAQRESVALTWRRPPVRSRQDAPSTGRESEWRGPRPITGWQKVRILPLPPTTRTQQNEQHRQTLRMCDRSGERARLLIWWRASAQRGFESRHILQPCSKHWTSYRSGRTGRTLNPMAQAHRRFESCLVLHVLFGRPCPRGEIGRRIILRG